MKHVYLVQPNNNLGKSVFLPYSIGTIAAFAFNHKEIQEEYCLCDFIFEKNDIEFTLSKISAPYIMGFSNYMWNIEYNLILAKKIKEKWPNCIVVFGGPQIPDDLDFLEEHQYIDILIHGEGEYPFYKILSCLMKNEELNLIPNISFRQGCLLHRTTKTNSGPLDDYPSPYTMGLFDYIINDPKYADIQFDAVVETNRGCPYKCIYCCWSGIDENFRAFPLERVKGDLEWIAKNKISFCICADSNFGVLSRDEILADYIISLKDKYGYPEKFETTAAKNKNDLTFRINCKFEKSNLNRGISLAVQSFSNEVLKIIGRENISFESFSDELYRYQSQNMYTYTDLILGLPGETFESFCKGLFSVIEAGQHNSININRCELLPNTKLSEKGLIEKYRIKTIVSCLRQNHSRIYDDSFYGSRSEIIVQTSTMNLREWRTALRLSVCVQSFHSLGILRCFAIYLRKAKGVSYYDFYMELYRWIETKSVFVKEVLDTVCKNIDLFLEGKDDLYFVDLRFGDVYWDFQEGLFLRCALEIDKFFEEIKDYLIAFFDDEKVFLDLFIYQKEIIARPTPQKNRITTNYDWYEYFQKTFDISFQQPNKKQSSYLINHLNITDLKLFAKEIVWYGKRNGKTWNKIEKCSI